MDQIEIRVLELRYEADGVTSVRLGRVDGSALPTWQPGAHIDLVLPVGLTRQYSIVEAGDNNEWYRIAVLQERVSRGGSEYVHLFLRPGQLAAIRGPRNHFELQPADQYLFIAGGIGITPIMSMIHAAERSGTPWRLHYAGRSRASMAFLMELTCHDDRVRIWPSEDGKRLNVDEILSTTQQGTVVYTCGPNGLVNAVTTTGRELGWTDTAIRSERFKPSDRLRHAQADEPILVRAALSGLEISVSSDETILSALTRSGIAVESSCLNGVCGTCEVAVLAGRPDHRDDVLGPDERSEGTSMLVCVSRALGSELVLEV